MASKYRVINDETKQGDWMTERDLLDLILICHNRNKYHYERLIAQYEHLEKKKFDPALIRKKNR